MRSLQLAAAALAVLLAPLAGVRAARSAPALDDLVSPRLVLPDDGLEVRLVAGINVEARRTAQPLSLAPDAWWGVTPRWTLGVIHSDLSVDQIDADAMFCVRQSEVSPCDRLYRGSGVDVRYAALEGALGLAPRLRLLVRDLDPWKPAITLGALVRWTAGRYAVTSDPYIRIPLAHRTEGNRAALFLPLWLALRPAAAWQLALHAGYNADFAVLHDGWHGPLSLAVIRRVTPALDVGLEAGWLDLWGRQHDGRHGALLITADWHR